jgi:hypothetical protein
MPRFFPERTIVWAEHEIAGLRRWTLVPAEIGLFTGIVLRTGNSLVMTLSGPSVRWTTIAAWYLAVGLLLCGAATLHLANFPVRQWLWRAPVFAAWETAGAGIASAVLIALHREFWGSAPAHLSDWPTIVVSTLLWHTLAICAYSAVLAGVVEGIRKILVRHDRAAGNTDASREWEGNGNGAGESDREGEAKRG